MADTSFGHTLNCRYIGGYQRVDIPINAGRAVCSDPPGADEQPPPDPPFSVGRASIDGGPPVEISMPITD